MQRDPVERAAGEDADLQGVATWEPRSRLDRVATAVHAAVLPTVRATLVLLALLILLALVVGGVLSTVVDPVVSGLVVLSAVPALLLAVYVWQADVTTDEPLTLLVGTFLLGLLFASFAGVINSVSSGVLGVDLSSGLLAIPFFFLVVGPVEETVKLLAVRLYAYEDGRFDAVVDGAVYGAVAGLGFATIENALYITQQLDAGSGAAGITAARALAGPGHVIYSSIAGYYLGLAKFNRDHAGPLVVKGLLLAAVVHALYNSLVGIVPAVLAVVVGVPAVVGLLGFVLVYDSLAGYYVYRKLSAYRQAYHDLGAGPGPVPTAELAEFDDGLGTEPGRSRTTEPAAED
jgi:RsiW-degrading membrane proteinase PrsW (M82 family)